MVKWGGIANLVSIPQLERDGYTVTYTTNKSWVVYTPEGRPITFGRDKGGPTDRFASIDLEELAAQSTQGAAFVTTVRQQMEGFTKREVQDARLAREAQLMCGVPSERDFKSMVSSSQIKNMPFKPDSIPDDVRRYVRAAAERAGELECQLSSRIP